MKRYKAIFFDWDGTAVTSRRAPVGEVVKRMAPLLGQGVALAVISGTTYENIAGGVLETHFGPALLENLFLGLARGAYCYRFDSHGGPVVWKSRVPPKKQMADIHRVCFELHLELLERYSLETDIVFSRPGYCKMDLMVGLDRGEHLFFQGGELQKLEAHFAAHGYGAGLRGLIDHCLERGRHYGLDLRITSDAKYLEVGTTTKSDNVDDLFRLLQAERGIAATDCCFWGDEYIGLANGLFGSDSFMMTEQTRRGDFFDVSAAEGERPPGVRALGGGIDTFHAFLREQAG